MVTIQTTSKSDSGKVIHIINESLSEFVKRTIAPSGPCDIIMNSRYNYWCNELDRIGLERFKQKYPDLYNRHFHKFNILVS